MSTSRRFIIANWKANHTLTTARDYVLTLRQELAQNPVSPDTQLVVCPPAIFYSSLRALDEVSDHQYSLGLQDISATGAGAHTGEITVDNLAGQEPAYCIIGHSERRRDQGETADLIAAKFAQLQRLGATAILCFDRPELPDLVASLRPFQAAHFPLILAYEPVSAISTSGHAGNLDPALVQQCRQQTWKALADFDTSAWAFVYGGSVKPENAGSYRDVCDGLLVGSASLTPDGLLAIARAFAGSESSHDAANS